MDLDITRAFHAAATARGATVPVQGSMSVNDWMVAIVEGWGGVRRSSLAFNRRVRQALRDISGTTEGALDFNSAMLEQLEAIAAAGGGGLSWNDLIIPGAASYDPSGILNSTTDHGSGDFSIDLDNTTTQTPATGVVFAIDLSETFVADGTSTLIVELSPVGSPTPTTGLPWIGFGLCDNGGNMPAGGSCSAPGLYNNVSDVWIPEKVTRTSVADTGASGSTKVRGAFTNPSDLASGGALGSLAGTSFGTTVEFSWNSTIATSGALKLMLATGIWGGGAGTVSCRYNARYAIAVPE